jgi:mannose-6-phosphate isomerase-like protein (cupin superfamily)
LKSFELDAIRRERERAGRAYLEFLRVPDLSLGLYVLPAGGHDPQSPHTEDEAYYVVSGRARIRVDEEVQDVRPGSIVFVEAGVPHRFEEIAEELTVLVVFGPAEYSRGTGKPLERAADSPTP